MFDNVLHQSASDLLSDDIAHDRLPGSILFSGPYASGKLTCALELSRVLSCRGPEYGAAQGNWSCACPSCLKHKALVSPSVLVVGPGNRTLEIEAAKETLLFQCYNNSRHVEASRYLYIRAVRKLTMRFNPILWQDDDKLPKFSQLLASIDEDLEQLEPSRALPDTAALEKCTASIEKNCAKLESSFLYEALPVSQIRNISSWAHVSVPNGKKILIVENADRMADSARNALLKILEEPPSDTMFILTTTRRGAMLPTILSRVRTYVFFERTKAQQQEVIERVFHAVPRPGEESPATVERFLQHSLSVPPDTVRTAASTFFASIAQGYVGNLAAIISACGGFEPRMLFRLFLEGVCEAQRKLLHSPGGAMASALVMEHLHHALSSVTVYNQTPQAALEELARNLMQVNYMNAGVLREAIT